MAKILILANHDLGLYKFRKELIQELIDRGNDIYISLPNGELVQALVSMGCQFVETEIDRRGLNPIKDLKILIAYFKLFKKIKPDMVISYTIKPNIYGGIVSAINKVPYAINITGLGTAFQNEGLLKKTITFLYKISCLKAKVVFFENEENQRIFINNRIVKKENTYKLNGAGVNLEEYPFCEYPIDNGEVRFLFIGRVMKEKGIDEFLDAARKIKAENENVQFDIVGPEEDSYVERLQSLQESGIINYYGYQKDVKRFIKKSHCFVLPSYHEGMANTLLECGAMGRPLITSNVHGCKETVEDGVSGFLCDIKNSNDLYQKMKSFVLMPYDTKNYMGKRSRQHIERRFDKKKVVTETCEQLRIGENL